jgi:hypothetical protein
LVAQFIISALRRLWKKDWVLGQSELLQDTI